MTSAQENYIRGELLVNFTDQGKAIILTNSKLTHNTGLKSIDKLNLKYNCYEMERVYLGPAPPLKGLYLLKFDANSDILNISEEYQKDSNVKNVSLNYILEVTETPDDYYFDEQWNHDNSHLQSELAWNYETGSDEIIISINDTGIDYLHPDLQNNIWVNPGEDLDGDGVVGDFGIPANGGDENGVDDDGNGYVDDLIGWDFYNNDKDPQHSSGSHGTKVAGMVAAEGDNSIGVAGVSWNSKLMPTRVGAGGSIYLDDAIEGIGYAADNGADVINFSWRGNGTTSGDLKTALDYAYDTKDLVLVAAAGNDTDSLRNYPAEYSKVIGVAALYENDTKRSNSCFGSWIDVSAPGHNLWTTDYLSGSHTYSYGGATSIAAPQVAGLAALIKSMAPSLENWMIRNIITSTTDNIDAVNPSYVGLLGTGRINSYNALNLISNVPSAPTNLSMKIPKPM
jgi:subtilisin family serine protease